MQRNLNTHARRFRHLRRGILIILAISMTACGPLGDDDSDPTATTDAITQPTSAAPDEARGTPSSFDTQPDSTEATAVINNPVSPQATPDEPFTVIVATPVEPEPPAQDVGQAATPGATEAVEVVVSSDGTSGATPNPGDPQVTDSGTPQADVTPTSDALVSDVATPEAVTVTELEPVTVSSCDPSTVPPLVGTPADFLTAVDVNFRTGPGTECDTIGAGPIGTNIPVTVLSGPVVREDDDQFVWVQVEILGQTGWAVLDALEPAP